ncbi:hypothetical protein NDN08_006480 [Rhodosorus marinus]|uniref:Mannosyltransferase n=1 Tax=Rhodosorus marinus TaxID=101924 RepID=A0AAV8ULB3_9RHOD|nr:hypothetical protein NDN08_006480 [Rhodosorus marinus]
MEDRISVSESVAFLRSITLAVFGGALHLFQVFPIPDFHSFPFSEVADVVWLRENGAAQSSALQWFERSVLDEIVFGNLISLTFSTWSPMGFQYTGERGFQFEEGDRIEQLQLQVQTKQEPLQSRHSLIGCTENFLLHLSELASKFRTHPSEYFILIDADLKVESNNSLLLLFKGVEGVNAESIISLPRDKLIVQAYSALEMYTAQEATIGALTVPELGDILISHKSRENFVLEVRLTTL